MKFFFFFWYSRSNYDFGAKDPRKQEETGQPTLPGILHFAAKKLDHFTTENIIN